MGPDFLLSPILVTFTQQINRQTFKSKKTMATRSRIAIENQDGTVSSIYCHNDGYPSHNGCILNDHYPDREKVEKLIALGSISSLAPEVEPTGPHSFDRPQSGTVVAYHRDRGEDLHTRTDKSIDSFVTSDVEEYGYIMTKEGSWLFIDGHTSEGRAAIPLENAVA
jgi:hypothetical protein